MRFGLLFALAVLASDLCAQPVYQPGGTNTTLQYNKLGIFGGINSAKGVLTNDGITVPKWTTNLSGLQLVLPAPGASREIIYNNNGDLAASSNHVWNNGGKMVGIRTNDPKAALHIAGGGAILSEGTTDGTPIAGAGTRFMWIPAKSASRAGAVSSTQWDAANIGQYSFAAGTNTQALGLGSFAAGENNTANIDYAFSVGKNNVSSGAHSITGGDSNVASGEQSVALGSNTDATGDFAFSMGAGSLASGTLSTAFGSAQATGLGSFSAGDSSSTKATAQSATAFGAASATNTFSFAAGGLNVAGGSGSFVGGAGAQALGIWSTAFGAGSRALGVGSFAAGTNALAQGLISFAGGGGSATNTASTAFGQARAEGIASFASGPAGTIARGEDSFAFNASATGDDSIAFASATISGSQSVGFGSGTASGNNIFVILDKDFGVRTNAPAATAHFGGTLSNAVLHVTSTSATGTNPYDTWYQTRTTTTDATATLSFAFNAAGSTTYLVESRTVARRTGGTGGTADDGAVYIRRAMITTKAAVVTMNALQDALSQEDQGAWDSAWSVTGGAVQLKHTGAASNNVTWNSTIRISAVGN